jgi:hypothetical protein
VVAGHHRVRQPRGAPDDARSLDASGDDPVPWHLHARCQIFNGLALPPRFSARLDYNPDAGPLAVTVVPRAGEWVGELSARAAVIDMPGVLQEILDDLTRRGVHSS